MTSLNLFQSFTLTWWQVGLFKLSMIALGVAIGARWPALFRGWLPALCAIFALAGGYVTSVWFRQLTCAV